MQVIDIVSPMIPELTAMIDAIIAILSAPFVQRAILGAFLVAIVAATSGTFLVFRGLSFMTSGVAHAALGGAALGLFLQYTGIAPWFDPILGALLFSISSPWLLGMQGRKESQRRWKWLSVFHLHYP